MMCRVLVLIAALLPALGAAAAPVERVPTAQPAMWYGGAEAKASGDTIDLMGPDGLYPYRGDFETANARPGGAGYLPDGWTSIDWTAPRNHWRVETFAGMAAPYAPLAGARSAWSGERGYSSCGGADPAGGYGNNWRDILEFRKSVGAGAHTVRVQALLRYHCEPAYDFTTLQRRTEAAPDFEPVAGGQGRSWDGGPATVTVDHTFTYAPAELLGGTDVAVAFIFDSDGAWSDGDCLFPSSGGAQLDNLVVTLDGVTYAEDFEDGVIGPDWARTSGLGVGDYARVWQSLGDLDVCASNYSKLVAFIDDGLVVPGTGGTVGQPGNDYGPPGGYIVNNDGGLLGPSYRVSNGILSPVMEWPDATKTGMSFAVDVYRHESLIPLSPGIYYYWSVRSVAAGGDIESAPWVDRGLLQYGGPEFVREINVVDDLIVANPARVQVYLGIYDTVDDFGIWPNGTPAPYFDNIRVKVYPTGGARFAVTEFRLANDGFPANGDIDLANLGRNSVRFDMAANISAKSHLRNDPGDSIWVDVTPRAGGTLNTPVMHWTFAVQNPLFDPYRALPANPVTGRVTRNSNGTVIANRWNFDLPDTGMIFPGDVLQYYFAATDNVAGDSRTAYAPQDRSQFGNPEPMKYPGVYTVRGLPTVLNADGLQPATLFWNDFGYRGGEDEWFGALRSLGLQVGVDYDCFTTHGPSSGVSNGLGGRATVNQIDGYTDMLYSVGDLSSPTLSNGDYNGDAGNDLGLLNSWFALGNRDLFMTGDDLATSLYASGAAARAFLETRMGVTYNDPDVRDNIAGQTAPLVVRIAGNPVFTTASRWIAYGGCPGINDFDDVVSLADATRLAQFTSPDGASTPYPYAAAVLNVSTGNNRVVSMSHDLLNVTDPGKVPAPLPARAVLLADVLGYFDVANDPGNTADVPASLALAVTAQPNPFNPAVTVRWTVPGPGRVTMKVYDIRGALVRTLLDEDVKTTAGAVAWDGADASGAHVSSGLYFVETRAAGQVDVRKVTMLK